MRTFRLGFAALAFAATLAVAGCSGQSGALAAVETTPTEVEALVTKLATESFKGKATAVTDLAPLQAALPKEVSLTWGNLSFDAASGATVLTGVKITPADMPAIGVQIAELRLWDFDAAFAAARLKGERLTETASLARRIDAKNISIFGLETVMEGVSNAVEDLAVSVIPEIPSPDAPPEGAVTDDPQIDPSTFAMKLNDYEFSLGRMVLDDVVLRPFEVAAAPAPAAGVDPELAMMMAPLQQLTAFSRSFGVDTLATYDLKGHLSMTQAGQTTVIDFGAPTSGTRGWRGSDIDASYVRDMFFSGSFSGPEINIPEFKVAFGLYAIEDFRLDKLVGYMAKGVTPPRTETDLMSYGLWTSKDEHWSVGGKDLYSVGDSTLDLRGFHWMVPTNITAKGNNITLDIGAIMEVVAGVMPPEELAAQMPQMQQVMAVLEKYDMTKLNMNYGAGWNWNAGSGETKIDFAWDAAKFLKFDAKYQGGFPAFQDVSKVVPDDPEKMDPDAIMNVFSEKSTLKLVDINLVDNGGLDKIFGLSAELASTMSQPVVDPNAPADGPAAAVANPFANMTGPQLRSMAGGLLPALAPPELQAQMMPIGAFITSGGKLHIGLNPEKPLLLMQAGMSMMTGMTSPDALLKQLGVKVEHTPPAAPAK